MGCCNCGDEPKDKYDTFKIKVYDTIADYFNSDNTILTAENFCEICEGCGNG